MTITPQEAPQIAQDERKGAPLSPRLPAEISHPNAGMGREVNKVNEELQERRTEYGEEGRQKRMRAALVHKFRPPSKMGAPTKYDNETMPQRVFDLLSRTDVLFTQKLVAAHLGVNVSTLKDWKGNHPDMAAAIAQGLAIQEAYLGSLMAGGMKYSASIYAVLKNLHDWSDKVEQRTTLDLTEAIRKQAQGAKRVQWDKALPPPGAPQQKAHVQAPSGPAPAPHTAPFAGPAAPAPAKGEHAPHA